MTKFDSDVCIQPYGQVVVEYPVSLIVEDNDNIDDNFKPDSTPDFR